MSGLLSLSVQVAETNANLGYLFVQQLFSNTDPAHANSRAALTKKLGKPLLAKILAGELLTAAEHTRTDKAVAANHNRLALSVLSSDTAKQEIARAAAVAMKGKTEFTYAQMREACG